MSRTNGLEARCSEPGCPLPDDTACSALAGANPSLTIWTELWGFQNEAPQRFYAELTPVATRASQRWVETYAGYAGGQIG